MLPPQINLRGVHSSDPHEPEVDSATRGGGQQCWVFWARLTNYIDCLMGFLMFLAFGSPNG